MLSYKYPLTCHEADNQPLLSQPVEIELFRLFDKRSPLSRFPDILVQICYILSAHCTAAGGPVERVGGRTKSKIVLMLPVVSVVNSFFSGKCIIAHFILNHSVAAQCLPDKIQDRKSTRLNSSHVAISYAVFC